MQAILTADQEMVAETAGRLMRGGLARARAAMDGKPLGQGPEAELITGWSGLGIAEEQGGAGGTLVEAALLAHAAGEAAEPGAFLPHFHAVHVLAGTGLAERLLADGRVAALATPDGLAGNAEAALLVQPAGGGWRLAEVAEARRAASIDPARNAARLTAGTVIGESKDSGEGLARVRVLLAAEACGLGRGAIALAADYAKTREQFGKPIGAYQAIAHRLAQATADIETAWSLTLYAAWAVTGDPAAAAQAARMAKASAGDAAIFAAESCVQTHGGMGITREADPHLFLKRALAVDAAWGASAQMYREIGAEILG